MLKIEGEVTVLVVVFQGVIESVYVYQDSESAEEEFYRETFIRWSDMLFRAKKESAEAILGNYAGTMLFDVEVE